MSGVSVTDHGRVRLRVKVNVRVELRVSRRGAFGDRVV